MTRLATSRSTAAPVTRHRRPWWLGVLVVGALLVLVAPAALVVTDQRPDPVYQHSWWSPIASIPAPALLIADLGLDLLVALAVVAAIRPLVRRLRGALLMVLTVLLAGALAGASLAVTQLRPDVTARQVRAVLLGHRPAAVDAEAASAIRLALGLPDTSASGVRILSVSAVPFGPFVVERTEVLNTTTEDEGTDVPVGSLVDPVSGRVLAAWFFGL